MTLPSDVFLLKTTWGDIERRALNDAVLHRVVTLVRLGRCSQLEAMMSIALWYSRDRDELLKEKVAAWERKQTDMTIVLKPSPGPGKRWVIDSMSPFRAHVEDV